MTKRLRPYALDLAHNGPRLLWLLLIFLAFALPWPAHGADGVYLGLQGGMSLGRMDGASRPQTISPEWVHPTRSDTAGSARLSVGYRRGLWALEVGTGTLHRYSENRDWQTACGGKYCALDDFQDIVQTSLEDFRKMQQVNVEGVFLGLKHAIPAIAERAHQWDGGGAIVNLSSVAGLVGAPLTLAYNASKGAVRLMTKAAALEFAQAGLMVRVNSVHPGIIDTPMMAEAAQGIEQATGEGGNTIRTRFADRHPLRRMGRDTDIANAIVFLASDRAAFMTGSELVVDGGMTAN
jgi:NAD(P)-dependent dehydrogenase (short-subunit alcohol dehydrogenase family)